MPSHTLPPLVPNAWLHPTQADWSLTEILLLQTPTDPSCPLGGNWDSSLSVCRMRMFMSTYKSNVDVSRGVNI